MYVSKQTESELSFQVWYKNSVPICLSTNFKTKIESVVRLVAFMTNIYIRHPYNALLYEILIR